MKTENFELTIPTHISCTLYENDEIDEIIISIIKECKNFSVQTDSVFTIKVKILLAKFKKNKLVKERLQEIDDTINTPEFKVNSLYFITNIIGKLKNLKLISFFVKNDINFSRVVQSDTKSISYFNFSVIEGIFDLTKIFDRRNLDNFNKNLISMNILPSKYIERIPYFYMKTDILLKVIEGMVEVGALINFDITDFVDIKIEKDDPLLLIKTDYSIY